MLTSGVDPGDSLCFTSPLSLTVNSAQCACDDCLLARAADDMDCVDTRYPDQPCDSSRDQSDNEPTPLFSEGIQAEIKKAV